MNQLDQKIRDKISKTVNSQECKQRTKATNIARYGVPYAMQNRELFLKQAKSARRTYTADGTRVDSNYEKVVYEFCQRNNLEFCQQVPITYEVDNIQHVTYIDFLIDGILVETKGSHLLKNLISNESNYLHEKLNIYRDYHVIVITDSDISELCNDFQIASADLKLFTAKFSSSGLCEIDIWKRLVYCAFNLSGFVDFNVISQVSSISDFKFESISDEELQRLNDYHQRYKAVIKEKNRISREAKGRRYWIYNPQTNQRTTVYQSEVRFHLDAGWRLGGNYTTTNGYQWINNDEVERRVPEDRLNAFLSSGWKIGRLASSTTKGYILIHKDQEVTSIPDHKLQEYLDQGWIQGEIPGTHFKGFVILTEIDTGKIIHVTQEQKEQYLATGKYIEQNALLGRIHINKDGKSKLVAASDLDVYLADGWGKGRLKAYTANKIWICHEELQKNLRIDESMLNTYVREGWRKGRLSFKRKSKKSDI